MSFSEYDYVELKAQLGPSLPIGTRGTILMVYPPPSCEYEVEFVNAEGESLEIRTVDDTQIRLVGADATIPNSPTREP